MAILGVVFLSLFGLDSLLSVAEEAIRSASGSFALVPARQVVADATIRAAAVTALLCAASPQLPARVYALPLAATFWLALGALPIPFVVAPAHVPGVLVATQLAIAVVAAGAMLRAVRRDGGWRAFTATRARASPRRLVVSLLVAAIALPTATLVYGAMALTLFVETASGGFVDFHAGGVSIAERRYANESRDVRLVGMMHLGQRDAYDELFDSFTGGSTLVLEEGVTDRLALLSTPLDYRDVGSAIGLDAQASIAGYFEDERFESGDLGEPIPPDVLHADVDVSDFSETTIAFIDRAGAIWSADDPLSSILAIVRERPTNEELNLFFAEIVGMRNDRLLAALDRADPAYRHVIVPWGALHMPAIARAVEERGFVLVDERYRPLITWPAVAAAVFR